MAVKHIGFSGAVYKVMKGGYSKKLIDSVVYYLDKIYQSVKQNPNCEEPNLRSFAAKYLDEGVIVYWEPYEKVHASNFLRVKASFK